MIYVTGASGTRITDDVKQVTGLEPGQFADYVRETAAMGVWEVEAKEATR